MDNNFGFILDRPALFENTETPMTVYKNREKEEGVNLSPPYARKQLEKIKEQISVEQSKAKDYSIKTWDQTNSSAELILRAGFFFNIFASWGLENA